MAAHFPMRFAHYSALPGAHRFLLADAEKEKKNSFSFCISLTY